VLARHFAVVAQIDDQRMLGQSRLIELVQNPPDLRVEILAEPEIGSPGNANPLRG
jgi:hypothetical protein